MEIKGKAYCLFEQSGTFKRTFISLGIPALDLDIQNDFGETDFVIDLFKEIDNAYNGVSSLFDKFTPDDLLLAFFSCIYFCDASQLLMRADSKNYKHLAFGDKTRKILQRIEQRNIYLTLLTKLCAICQIRGLRLIVENPWTGKTFLKDNFFISPSYIDWNRRARGDAYKKPTAYFFVNCEPTFGDTCVNSCRSQFKTVKESNPSASAGVCSCERSMISEQYAISFICDKILGKRHKDQLLTLF